MIEISDINHPDIQSFRSLKEKIHLETNTFIVESENIVLKLLHSDFPLIKLFAVPDFYEKHHALINLRSKSQNSLFCANKKIMENIIGHRLHHGVMALSLRPNQIKITNLNSPVVILNGVSSPENVGSIVRNAIAFNINHFICDNASCNPFTRRSVRVSMGSAFRINIHQSKNLVDDLIQMKKMGYSIIGSSGQGTTIAISDYQLVNSKYAIIIGSEGSGIQGEVRKLCDAILNIPIDQGVHSLNAATASGILFYEMAKKKRE